MLALVEYPALALLALVHFVFARVLEFYKRSYAPNQTFLQRLRMPALSQQLYDKCHSTQTVSSLLATDPHLSPGQASEKLFGSHGFSVHEQKAPRERKQATPEELKRSAECGNWGPTQPSEKFLRIWHDALMTLEHDPLNGVVSPPLMGSSGTVPINIIGPLPDICRHMSNLIARAQHEVILATNYWKESQSSTLITDALKELSRRAGARGQRAVVKIIYDRGSPKQFLKNHLDVKPAERVVKGVAIPSNEDLPHVDLEVINYHRPALGTFHAKFLIVDRKFAIVQSNNIQDNDNLEMATQLEGPIVDSLYDMALLTWHDQLIPHLPLIATPTTQVDIPDTYADPEFAALLDDNGHLKVSEVNNSTARQPMHNANDPHYDTSIAASIRRLQSNLTPSSPTERAVDLIAAHLNSATSQSLPASGPDFPADQSMTPLIPHAPHAPFPIALVNRKPWGALNHSSVNVPQNEAWLSAIRHAERSIFIQSPDINAEPLLPELIAAAQRGVEVTLYACLGYNDLGELLPLQGGTNEMVFHGLATDLDSQPASGGAEAKHISQDEAQDHAANGTTTPTGIENGTSTATVNEDAATSNNANLKLYFYVAKDQSRPLHNKFKQRSCHIKLLIVDDEIGMQGSGNQDTQSWYHSQEVNILLQSASTCQAWMAGIRRNQNTHLYGRCGADGVWRDEEGKEALGSMGVKPGGLVGPRGSWVLYSGFEGKVGFRILFTCVGDWALLGSFHLGLQGGFLAGLCDFGSLGYLREIYADVVSGFHLEVGLKRVEA